jgi:S1-C subfamily serine protease
MHTRLAIVAVLLLIAPVSPAQESQGLVLPGVEVKQRTTVAGQIVGPDGKARADVQVAVMASTRRLGKIESLPLAQGRTDAQGRFRLTARPMSPPRDKKLTVYTIAPGYAVGWSTLDIYRGAHEATLHLQPDRPVRGRVVDLQGKPVMGTGVRLLAVLGRPSREEARLDVLRFPDDPFALKPTAVLTDRQGRFVLRGISRETSSFGIGTCDSRYAPQVLEFKANAVEPQEITITVRPPRAIEGELIYGETGTPASDAEVVIASYSFAQRFMLRGLVKGRVDPRGHFRLIPCQAEFSEIGIVDLRNRFLPLLRWESSEDVFDRTLKLIVPDGVKVRSATQEGAETDPAIATGVEIARPRSGATLMGRAVGPNGKAIVDGVVLGEPFTPISQWGAIPPIRDGQFAVPGLISGKRYQLYFLDVQNQWGAMATVTLEDPRPLTVQLVPCGSATARLVDEKGQPFSLVSVRSPDVIDLRTVLVLTSASPLAGRSNLGKPAIETSGLGDPDPRYRELRTDPNGRVTFPTLIPGAEYRIVGSGEVLVRKNGFPVQVGESVVRDDAFVLLMFNSTRKQFRVRSGETLDLGEVRVHRRGVPIQPSFEEPAGIAFPLGGAVELKAIESRVSRLKPRVLPSVVALEMRGGRIASGVVVSEDGYVMTVAHALEKPGEEIVVKFTDGRTTKGKALGICPTLDIGLIKIDEDGRKWPSVERGRPKDLQAGDWCVSVGYPGRYNKELTPVACIGRIIDAAGREVLSVGPMASGDSGGAFFDLEGRLVGILQAPGCIADITVSIPVDTFEKYWPRLIHGEFWEFSPYFD